MPIAFQRMPPRSQMEVAKPHRQRTFQRRESASIDSAQLLGKIDWKKRWIMLMAAAFVSGWVESLR